MTEQKENTGFFGNLSEIKLNELRKMLIGLDSEDLQRLADIVNDPDRFSAEISELLPHSVKKLVEQGKVSYSDFIPLIEEALKTSIRNNPHTLSEILFPVMLPAIRKAVADDIRNMISSLNTTLEHSFSPRRIGWRFKAMFSGMSYTEIVLSHAYIYRVKQVFLIHKKTGILLNSVSDSDDTVTKDEDMVSSMLSAIKDFVQDSFSVSDDNELNTIKVGKFNIWIEQGPSAILAVVIDGDAPATYRNILKDSIEKVHLKFSLYLEDFNGDISKFENTGAYLQNCILSEQKTKKKKKPVLLIVIFILLIGIGSYFGYLAIEKALRINKLSIAMESEPGILITEKEREDGKTIFYGLRDPDAVDPVQLSKTKNVDTSEVEFKLKAYLSLDNGSINNRAIRILSPPETVTLSNEHGILYVSGTSNRVWFNFLKENYIKVTGITGLEVNDLNIVDEKVPIPHKLSIEEYYFVFDYNVEKLDDDQRIKFDSLISEVNDELNFDFDQDSVPVIQVIGHTSYDGNPEANEKFAFKRSQQFIGFMIDAGIPLEVLVPKTNFIEDIEYKFPVRSVSFKVIYSKPEDL